MNRTIYEIFSDSAKRVPNRIAMMYKKQGQYRGITYAELKDTVDAIASAIQKFGIKKGDAIAIASYNRPEWAIADLAILKLGGVVVPVYHMPDHLLPPDYIKYILNDSKVKLIFVEDAELFSVIEQIRSETPSLKKVVLFDHSNAGEKDFARFTDMRKEDRAIKEVASPSADDVATIVYTSGTTGVPKGVVLTHNNIISNTLSASKKYNFTPEDVVISYLPLAHMFERTCGYYTVIFTGGCIGYAENFTTIAQDAEEIRPTVFLAVPRVIEKAYNAAAKKIEGSSPFKQGLVSFAIRNLNEYANLRYKKKSVPLWLKLKCGISKALVASKFKKLGGGRIRLIVSGSAPLNRQIAKTFYILGFNIVEGYGLTETSPVVTCNGVEDNRLGTVGKPLEEVEVRIGEDDEILVRGPNLMKCYFNKPEETAKVIDQDGWFHTGDQGKFDKYGNLIITGRIKELIVTSGGKKIAPVPIEAKICMSQHVEQIMLCGDKRQYLVAVVVPNRESIEQYAGEKNILFESYSSLLQQAEIKGLMRNEIEEATIHLASYEKVKAFVLLEEDFAIENGLLTATFKLRRSKVVDKYCDLIEAMYCGDKTVTKQERIAYM